jgi:D-alanine-D-alanine ligase
MSPSRPPLATAPTTADVDGPLRLAVIGGGRNSEHDVSLASAAGVVQALSASDHEVLSLTIERDHSWRLPSGEVVDLARAVELLVGCDVVIPMLHGQHGEDGTIAALCELADVPYTGSGVRAGAVGMDKWVTRLVARELGIGVAPAVLLTAASVAGYTWRSPVVVKPVSGGSSLGVARADSAEEFATAVRAALLLDERVLVEDVITGRELDVPVLRSADGSIRLGATVEIVSEGFYDYEKKYCGEPLFQIPAPLTAAEQEILHGAAIRLYEGLGCEGVARIDFFLTEDGPVLIEANTAPGFTSKSQVPMSFAATGVSYLELVEALVREALTRAR